MKKFEICENCPITNKDDCLIEFGSKECAKILVSNIIKDQDIVIKIQATNKASEEVQTFLVSSLKKRYRDIIVKSFKTDLLDKIADLKALVLFNPNEKNQVDLMVKINKLIAKIQCDEPIIRIRHNSYLDIMTNCEDAYRIEQNEEDFEDNFSQKEADQREQDEYFTKF